jgi:hypothetical protein
MAGLFLQEPWPTSSGGLGPGGLPSRYISNISKLYSFFVFRQPMPGLAGRRRENVEQRVRRKKRELAPKFA